ncbi:ATP phosphoribosyltransferase regulatory subunit [Roseburia sp. MSJ-14]|uniref:ATP phosphoribosyltransferase regulatory subunit n=1 Tax=Roseburia sp. MSJ-14 TaxID=2841514 RepID=UPI001C117E8B|nr:ATP phosphoribosyltransferase regulatory subunit [Roseburia sp. MSJ-14]MBU5472781.1 ATP phosphoribosyltransferase regulatory subunit [Roseburia sp. MSJ-14]
MERRLLHTPEGVRDIYNSECAKKLVLQDNLHGLLKKYGYHAIETPTFEFFDIFGKEIGTTPSKDLYKFFDREGNTLVLRPDITPSVARCVAKYYAEEELPVRLCYMGNTFINNTSYQGRLKESTQLGAEMIGDNSVDADAEIIALVVNSLKTAGLQEFQIGIGHVGFFKGLIEAAKLPEETVSDLIALISNKNFFGVEELIDSLGLTADLKELFSMLGSISMSEDMLNRAKELAVSYPTVLEALERLELLLQVLSCYGVEKYVSLEPGMLSTYHYYTGIIFAGYTFGSGEPIVKGGRYDNLLPYFGKNAPSIGFAVVIDQLMAALSRQKIEIPIQEQQILIVYKESRHADAIKKALALREDGTGVSLVRWEEGKVKEDYDAYAKRMHMQDITYME